MKPNKGWTRHSSSVIKSSVTEMKKEEILKKCQPMITLFKTYYLKERPDKKFNYLIDIYARWRGNYLFFCEKYKSEGPYRSADEFEVKFVRLECIGRNRFNFSYFRHTGQWFLVTTDITLQDCMELMQENPTFQPIG